MVEKSIPLIQGVAVAGFFALSMVAYLVTDAVIAGTLFSVGTGLFFVPLLWAGPAAIDGRPISKSDSEERHFEAGWYSYLLLLWAVGLFVGLAVFADYRVPVEIAVVGFTISVLGYHSLLRWME